MQVLLAFAMPALLSNAVLAVAYLSHTLPDSQYTHFDTQFPTKETEMALKFVGTGP